MMMNVEVLSDKATPPRPFMGYHLCAAADVLVPAHGEALIKTDLNITVPEGITERVVTVPLFEEMRVLSVGEGQIIRDGEQKNVSFILYQRANQDYLVKAGDIVAQLILERAR